MLWQLCRHENPRSSKARVNSGQVLGYCCCIDPKSSKLIALNKSIELRSYKTILLKHNLELPYRKEYHGTVDRSLRDEHLFWMERLLPTEFQEFFYYFFISFNIFENITTLRKLYKWDKDITRPSGEKDSSLIYPRPTFGSLKIINLSDLVCTGNHLKINCYYLLQQNE